MTHQSLITCSPVSDCARARSAIQSPRRWPRRRDGALVASLSGRAARARDRLAVMSCIFPASSSRHSASAVAQDEHLHEKLADSKRRSARNSVRTSRPQSASAATVPYYTYLKRMKSPKSANCAGQFLEVGARKTEEVGATQIRKSIFASELVESSLLHTL